MSSESDYCYCIHPLTTGEQVGARTCERCGGVIEPVEPDVRFPLYMSQPDPWERKESLEIFVFENDYGLKDFATFSPDDAYKLARENSLRVIILRCKFVESFEAANFTWLNNYCESDRKAVEKECYIASTCLYCERKFITINSKKY
jgi:hypothetical protein